MDATTKDLRFHTKELLDTVSRGEEVVITYRGKPTARLVPIKKVSNTQSEQTSLFGIWKDREDIKPIDEYIRTIRKGRFE